MGASSYNGRCAPSLDQTWLWLTAHTKPLQVHCTAVSAGHYMPPVRGGAGVFAHFSQVELSSLTNPAAMCASSLATSLSPPNCVLHQPLLSTVALPLQL